MATTKTMTGLFDVSPERLLAVLTNPDFLVAQQQLDPATIEARVEEISRSKDRLVLELHSTEYGRGLLGIDRSKTETSVTTYRWDLSGHRCEWIHRGAHSDRFKAEGSDCIEPDGDGSRLTTEFRLDVTVPLIGKKIEKMVLKELDERQPRYERVVREFCARLE